MKATSMCTTRRACGRKVLVCCPKQITPSASSRPSAQPVQPSLGLPPSRRGNRDQTTHFRTGLLLSGRRRGRSFCDALDRAGAVDAAHPGGASQPHRSHRSTRPRASAQVGRRQHQRHRRHPTELRQPTRQLQPRAQHHAAPRDGPSRGLALRRRSVRARPPTVRPCSTPPTTAPPKAQASASPIAT